MISECFEMFISQPSLGIPESYTCLVSIGTGGGIDRIVGVIGIIR